MTGLEEQLLVLHNEQWTTYATCVSVDPDLTLANVPDHGHLRERKHTNIKRVCRNIAPTFSAHIPQMYTIFGNAMLCTDGHTNTMYIKCRLYVHCVPVDSIMGNESIFGIASADLTHVFSRFESFLEV